MDVCQVSGVAFDPFWSPPNSDGTGENVVYRFGSVGQVCKKHLYGHGLSSISWMINFISDGYLFLVISLYHQITEDINYLSCAFGYAPFNDILFYACPKKKILIELLIFIYCANLDLTF